MFPFYEPLQHPYQLNPIQPPQPYSPHQLQPQNYPQPPNPLNPIPPKLPEIEGIEPEIFSDAIKFVDEKSNFYFIPFIAFN